MRFTESIKSVIEPIPDLAKVHFLAWVGLTLAFEMDATEVLIGQTISFFTACFGIIVYELVRFMTHERLWLRWSTFDRSKVVSSAPGSRLLAIAEFLYHPQTVELRFKVLIGDLQFEYFEALKENRRIRAKYLRVKYFFLFLTNMGLSKLWSAVSAIKQVIK